MAVETINYPDGSKFVGTFRGWHAWDGDMFCASGKLMYAFDKGYIEDHHIIYGAVAESAEQLASKEMLEEAQLVATQLSENFD